MKNSLVMATLIVSVGIFILPAHAAPQPTSGLYNVKGLIASKCSLGASSGPITVTTNVDKNGKLDPSLNGRTFVITGVLCTTPSTIALKASALRINSPRAGLPNGQSQTANFTATATGWASVAATVTTAQTNPLGSPAVFTGASQAQNAAKVGTVTVSVNNFTPVVRSNGNGSKLIEGPYSGTVTISLTPSS